MSTKFSIGVCYLLVLTIYTQTASSDNKLDAHQRRNFLYPSHKSIQKRQINSFRSQWNNRRQNNGNFNFDGPLQLSIPLDGQSNFKWNNFGSSNNDQTPNRQYRPNNDNIFFPEDDRRNSIYTTARPLPLLLSTAAPVRTTSVDIPGMETAPSNCELKCASVLTPQYNPVCGTNRVTYASRDILQCARNCGKDVDINHLGICTRKNYYPYKYRHENPEIW